MVATDDASATGNYAGRLFCFGMGYSAGMLSRVLQEKGWYCSGTSRSPERDSTFPCFHFDADSGLDPAGYADFLQATHILHSIPPQESGDPVMPVIESAVLSPALQWFGYFSTTGVYGNHDGRWVDETTPPNPSGIRQQRRAAAEQAWIEQYNARKLPVHIFRLAGIYGPSRSSFDALRNGTARRIDKPEQVFSRIHVEDIVNVVLASFAYPNPGRTYNVCDDLPAPSADVTAYAASLLGMEAPPLRPFDRADLSPMARSFYRDNRRVKNLRIKDELGVKLAYPSYKEGLEAILAQETTTSKRQAP